MKKIAIIQNVTINDHRFIHTHGIALELLQRGYQIDVIAQKSEEKPQFNNFDYNLITLKGQTYSIYGQIIFILNCLKTLKKQKYDLLHTKNPFSSLVPALVYQHFINKNCKVIYDIRGLWIDFAIYSKRLPKFLFYLLNWIEVYLSNKAHKLIAISEELKKILVKRGIDEKKIKVIVGDGVNYEEIMSLKKLDIKEKLKIKGKVICYLGSISRSRCSEKIIEAFEFVKDKIKNVNLVFIGPIDKREKPFFNDFVKNKDFNSRVFFMGFIPHERALKYLKSCDILIAYHERDLPIYNVMVPTKILEYLVIGIPIVATDHKAYKNLLSHKKTAFLTGQNPQSFAEGIIEVLRSPELQENLKKNALKEGTKYSFTRIVDQIEAVYKSIL